MSASQPRPQGALSGLVSATLGLVKTQVELFALEWHDEKDRIIAMLSLVLITACLSLLVLIGISATLILAVDPAQRLLTALLLTIGYIVLLLLCLFKLRRMQIKTPVPFSESLDELTKTRSLLSGRPLE